MTPHIQTNCDRRRHRIGRSISCSFCRSINRSLEIHIFYLLSGATRLDISRVTRLIKRVTGYPNLWLLPISFSGFWTQPEVGKIQCLPLERVYSLPFVLS